MTAKASPKGEQTEVVAWYNPSNNNPSQSVTFSRPDRDKWPHLYPVALYAHPAGAEAPSVVGAGIDCLGRLTEAMRRDDPVEYYTGHAFLSGEPGLNCLLYDVQQVLAALSPQALGEELGSSSPKSEDTHRAQETPVVEWQPIETAPKDGRWIIVSTKRLNVFAIRWKEGHPGLVTVPSRWVTKSGYSPDIRIAPDVIVGWIPAPSPTAGDE